MLSQSVIEQSMAERMAPIKNKVGDNDLLIHEIYSSLQGESSYMGMPCVFVRTAGCHLRCTYCDTEHAFFKGQEKSLDQIMREVKTFGINLVELTGGEPLLQRSSSALLDRLVKENFTALVETSGAVSIKNINQQVKVILDIKTPSSGESSRNVYSNLEILWPGCEVKFVISNFDDYLFAKKVCEDFDLFNKTHVLFSPVVANIDAKDLASYIMSDRLPVRFQLQLHRILYGEAPGK